MYIGNLVKFVLSLVLLQFISLPKLSAQEPLINMKPCLCDAMIEPQTGSARTTYIASVRYQDQNGKAPATIQVFVDDVGYPLKRLSGTANNGIYKCKLTLPPGEHSYYFYAEDDQGRTVRMPRYNVKKGPTVGVINLVTEPAKLSNGGALQESGTNKTVLTYTTHYYDPQSKIPQKVYVVIDDIKYPMHRHKGVAYNGTYLASITLPPGDHGYYFSAIDAAGNCITLPEDGYIRGPEITEMNNVTPQLSDEKTDPSIGYKSTAFTYLVKYVDPDFDPPSIINVVINGESYPLKLKAGKSYDGIYSYRTKLFLGNLHNYYFYCEDGRGGTCRMPPKGAFHGPVVVK